MAASIPAELLLINGNVLTMDAARRTVSGVAVSRGVIVAVGSDAELATYRDPHTRVLDAGGRTVTPGLIDITT